MRTATGPNAPTGIV